MSVENTGYTCSTNAIFLSFENFVNSQHENAPNAILKTGVDFFDLVEASAEEAQKDAHLMSSRELPQSPSN